VDASQYIVPGAVLIAGVLVLAFIVVLVRRRLRGGGGSRDAGIGDQAPHEWLPPETPAPLDRLASASLEARIASWVATPPQSPSAADGSSFAEPAGEASPAGEAAFVDSLGSGVSVSAPCKSDARDSATEALPLTSPPVKVIPPAADATPVTWHDSAAPVELWVDGTRVLVHSDSEASAEFRRYADELLADLARARKRE